jgi:hypothetical protein
LEWGGEGKVAKGRQGSKQISDLKLKSKEEARRDYGRKLPTECERAISNLKF